MTLTTKQRKQVHVIARIELKAHPGIVVYKVRSSNGVDIYETTFALGKVTHCTCRGWQAAQHCYHADQLQEREDARLALERRIDQDLEHHVLDDLAISPIDPRQDSPRCASKPLSTCRAPARSSGYAFSQASTNGPLSQAQTVP